MARNVEIKARIQDPESVARKAKAVADKGPIEIVQDDTFFACPNGRLKLRSFCVASGVPAGSVAAGVEPAGREPVDVVTITSGKTVDGVTLGRKTVDGVTAGREPARGELIFYMRPDQSGPKESYYLISPTSEPDTLRELLSQAYGQAGRVRKHRTLFLAGRTRIHLDQVENLGHFLELEVVLAEGESPEKGEEVARYLMDRLGILPDQLIEGAYVDLLNAG